MGAGAAVGAGDGGSAAVGVDAAAVSSRANHQATPPAAAIRAATAVAIAVVDIRGTVASTPGAGAAAAGRIVGRRPGRGRRGGRRAPRAGGQGRCRHGGSDARVPHDHRRVVLRHLGERGRDRAREFGGALVTIGRLLGQCALHHRVPARNQRGVERRRRRCLLVQQLVHHGGHRAGERLLAGQQLVQHDAAREQVGASVDRLAEQLLGRHVARRADHRAGLREIRRVEPRDAEVGHLDLAVVLQKHVARLDVAVHDAALVRMLQRGQHGAHHAHRLFGREPLALVEHGRQLAATHHLHRDEGALAAGVLAVLVDGDDARVRQPAGRLRFALQACAQLAGPGGAEVVLADHLERDAALDQRIEALVDDAHRACAELAQDLVLAQALGRWHRAVNAVPPARLRPNAPTRWRPAGSGRR